MSTCGSGFSRDGVGATVAAKAAPTGLRPDLATLSEWITPGARVLDLGCGDGALLSHLSATRKVHGYGLEIDPENIAGCLARGVNVIEADVDDGLEDFDDASFDFVVMTQALQAMQRPDFAVQEMLRVGRTAIVTFPNFGHWRVRLALAAGHMPTTPALPAAWFDSPNIHLCTVADFDALCAARAWRVLRRSLLDHSRRDDWAMRLMPNLLAEVALYMLSPPLPPLA